MKNKVIEALKGAKKVAIYIHINVDCDAMGSALALREALMQLGSIADIYVNSAFPNSFKVFGDLDFINQKSCSGKYDLVCCLDSANEGRLGKYKYTYKSQAKNTLLIDHHDIVSTRFCKINYVLHSSSTCEILYDILKSLNITFTKSICKNLMTGIITDTGKFMYSLSAETFNVAGSLMKKGGFNIEEIANPLMNSMRMEVFNQMKLAYSKIEFYADGKLAIIMFSKSDFEETGANMEELDVFPDIPLQLECVQFAILASEDDKGYFRVSLRSKGDISAKDVAALFGGGGHLNASGCKIFGEYDDVKSQLIDGTLQTLGWKI